VFQGGTFHLLTPADYPLPREYDIAYNASNTLVLETDLEKFRDPAFQPTLRRAGDTVALDNSAPDSDQKEFPELMESMLYQRNAQWLPVMERMIADKDTEFVLVGALHLVGKRGLLSQLQRRGYRVEKVSIEKISDLRTTN